MAKRKVGSPIGNLTPNHKKSGIDPTFVRADGVQHTVGKLSTRATTLLSTSSRSKVWTRSYDPAKLQKSNLSSFGTPLWESWDKKAIWLWASRRGIENTIWEKVVASPKSEPWWVLWVQSRSWFVLTPKVLQHNTNQFVVGWMQNRMNE